jgi:diguanylate cyclase (GGDEF)-like protein
VSEQESLVSTQVSELVEEDHSWLSNPLDWRFIDRLIILSLISESVSLLFAGVTSLSVYIQRGQESPFLNESVAKTLIIICSLHFVINACFTYLAFEKRKSQADWPAFAYVVVFSYVSLVYCFGYFTGTYFSDGIVLLLFGFALCLPLVDLDILTKVYVFAWLAFIALMFGDLSEALPFAPLFNYAPYEGERLVFGWHLLRVVFSFAIFFAIFFVTLPTTRRWRDREDLYREMSSTDGLTRLTNRRSFLNRSNAEFSKLQRMPGKLACIMIDLDYFKHINDTYGHQAGDEVLVKVAEILADNARDYDEVGRYGGEEFAILLPNTNKENASKIAERIRKTIEETAIDIGEKELSITASLGVASYPAQGVNDMNGLLKLADDALYEAKEKSRNVVVVSEK